MRLRLVSLARVADALLKANARSNVRSALEVFNRFWSEDDLESHLGESTDSPKARQTRLAHMSRSANSDV